MSQKLYKCAYSHCLHPNEKVSAAEAVVINKKHYHWDCAELSQEIKACVDAYMDCIEDKSQYLIAYRIINTLVFKNLVPPEYILKKINSSHAYYKDKSPMALYGLRKLFWEKEW